MTMGEKEDKTVLKIESFAVFDNSYIVATKQWKTRITAPALPIRVSRFFVLPSFARECNSKVLELLYLLQCRSIHLQHALIRVSWKMKYLSFGCAYFYSGGVARICEAILRAGDQILGKKTKPNYRRIADDWFSNFQSWTLVSLAVLLDPIHVKN